MQLQRAALWLRVMYARVSNTLQDVAACVTKKAAKQIEKPDAWKLGMVRTRLLAFHWALASHVVRVAVVHLQLPPWFRVGVHCGRGGQWRAVVCLYMHLKVGRSGETWDQRNKNKAVVWHTLGFTATGPGSQCTTQQLQEIIEARWGWNSDDWQTEGKNFGSTFISTSPQFIRCWSIVGKMWESDFTE